MTLNNTADSAFLQAASLMTTQGARGATGAQGVAGTSGTSGVDGTSGTSGVNGLPGPVGPTGPPDGSSGTSGVSGTSGTSGTSGVNGATGAQGATGEGGGVGAQQRIGNYNGSTTLSGGFYEATVSFSDYGYANMPSTNYEVLITYQGADNKDYVFQAIVDGVSSFRIRSSEQFNNQNIGWMAIQSGEWYAYSTSGTSGSSGTSGVSGLQPGSATSSFETAPGLTTTAADASAACAIAIGNATISCQTQSITIGNTSCSTGCNSIVIGNNVCSGTFNGGTNGVTIGNNTKGGDKSVAIGCNANADADRSVSIGADLLNGGLYNVNLGYNNNMGDFAFSRVGIGSCLVMGQVSCAIAIGDQSTVCASRPYAGSIGFSNMVGHTGAMLLGCGMTSIVENHAHVNALWIQNAPVYADNSAAISAGLTGGQVYKTSTGTLQIVY